MVLKLLIIAVALFVAIAVAEYPAPLEEDDDSTRRTDHGLPTERCNETFCYAPCEGAASPPKCPTNMPKCPTGCACIKDCSNNNLICFMTKHCMDRRVVTKRRLLRVISQDVDFHSSTEAQNKGRRLKRDLSVSTGTGTINRLTERDLPAFTIAQNIGKRADAEPDLVASTVTQTISRRAERDFLKFTVAHTIGRRTKRDLLASTIDQTIVGGTNRDLQASTVAHTIGRRTERDLQASTAAYTISRRMERNFPEASAEKVMKAREKKGRKPIGSPQRRPRNRTKNAGTEARVHVTTVVCLVVFAGCNTHKCVCAFLA